MAILVDEGTRLVVQGLTGREGRFHALRNRDYGTNLVAGVTPGKAGQDVEGIPVFNTVASAWPRPGQHLADLRARPLRRRRPLRGRRRRHRGGRHHREHPGAGHDQGLQLHQGQGRRPGRAELPRGHLARQGERRHHPRRDHPRRAGRPGVALGHPHLPGDVRDGGGRGRPDDLRRHRRRPGGRLQLHRRPRALPGRPRDRGRGDDRRDRRRRGGAGGPLHRRGDGQAGGRLHRRVRGPAGQAHGPRRGDHLRLQRHRPGQGRGPGGGRGPGRRNPTEAAELAVAAVNRPAQPGRSE